MNGLRPASLMTWQAWNLYIGVADPAERRALLPLLSDAAHHVYVDINRMPRVVALGWCSASDFASRSSRRVG